MLILGLYIIINIICITSDFGFEHTVFLNLFFLTNHIGMFIFEYYYDLKRLKIKSIKEFILFYKANTDHIMFVLLFSFIVSCFALLIFSLYLYLLGIEIFF